MLNDAELLRDILRAAARLLAQKALRERVDRLGNITYKDEQHMPWLNAAARCEMLAEETAQRHVK